jgi:hypothetical protein
MIHAINREQIGEATMTESRVDRYRQLFTQIGDEPARALLDRLQRLDEVARTFDTMCISTLQVLGEGLNAGTLPFGTRILPSRSAVPV